MTDFFKQLVGLPGYGLVGLTIVMLIVLAYVMIKKPNNKFVILLLTGFLHVCFSTVYLCGSWRCKGK
jgi:hypothetical protein